MHYSQQTSQISLPEFLYTIGLLKIIFFSLTSMACLKICICCLPAHFVINAWAYQSKFIHLIFHGLVLVSNTFNRMWSWEFSTQTIMAGSLYEMIDLWKYWHLRQGAVRAPGNYADEDCSQQCLSFSGVCLQQSHSAKQWNIMQTFSQAL